MRSPLHKSGEEFGADRTPLKTIRHLGSAKSGTEHFIQQRLTALANMVLVIVLAVVAIMLSGRDYASAVALVGSPWVAVPLGLAIISVAVHMKLGIQVVIEDYVHGGMGIVLMLLNTFFAVAIAATAIFAIVKIMLAVLTGGSVETGA
ncbi:succinate dehydrogenase, hydrophobic membrane anchor protein [Acuticoccus sp. I52.16.1]|uniref:succinate dehydrogenase, hydrophobic membrane anchor protein n=1 Tax=Acuticoccus sp. I52.16.1 TaxID=2928472 RepID=UPI001FD20452|nr:succinate dehydrogenase, hydrophobic membrane anchor protein [Acuticoccus sp. I52.16.1]UOM36361.1 succinate dehydrogenase, hydrophobic membrane anchor protein [Acuticoccus sp. I52.16.1]